MPFDRDDLLAVQRDIKFDSLQVSGATLDRLRQVAQSSGVDLATLFRDIVADALELAAESDGDYYAQDEEDGIVLKAAPPEVFYALASEGVEEAETSDGCADSSPYLIDYMDRGRYPLFPDQIEIGSTRFCGMCRNPTSDRPRVDPIALRRDNDTSLSDLCGSCLQRRYEGAARLQS